MGHNKCGEALWFLHSERSLQTSASNYKLDFRVQMPVARHQSLNSQLELLHREGVEATIHNSNCSGDECRGIGDKILYGAA